MKNMRYILIGFIFAYLIKCLAISPSLQDSMIVLVLSLAFCVSEYFSQSRIPKIKDDLKKAQEELLLADRALKEELLTTIEGLRIEIKQLKMDVSKTSIAAIKPNFKF